MSRKIVVSSNCQTGGVAAALRAMLPTDVVVPVPWIWDGTATATVQRELRDADVWVTSARGREVDQLIARRDLLEVRRIPCVLFGGFHPDTVYVTGPNAEWVESPIARMHSALVLWCWRNRLGVEQTVASFTREVMERLGYTEAWTSEVNRLRDEVNVSDIDFASFFLPLQSRIPFMLSVNHPRINVLVQIARPIALALGADRDRIAYPWETVLPDALLAVGPAWPVYPTIAESLGITGGFVWRRPNGEFITLDQFIAESFDRYDAFEPDELHAPALEDARFHSLFEGSTRT